MRALLGRWGIGRQTRRGRWGCGRRALGDFGAGHGRRVDEAVVVGRDAQATAGGEGARGGAQGGAAGAGLRRQGAQVGLGVAGEHVHRTRQANAGGVRRCHTASQGDHVGRVLGVDDAGLAQVLAVGIDRVQGTHGDIGIAPHRSDGGLVGHIDHEGPVQTKVLGFATRSAQADVHVQGVRVDIQAVAKQRDAVFDLGLGRGVEVGHQGRSAHGTLAVLGVAHAITALGEVGLEGVLALIGTVGAGCGVGLEAGVAGQLEVARDVDQFIDAGGIDHHGLRAIARHRQGLLVDLGTALDDGLRLMRGDHGRHRAGDGGLLAFGRGLGEGVEKVVVQARSRGEVGRQVGDELGARLRSRGA